MARVIKISDKLNKEYEKQQKSINNSLIYILCSVFGFALFGILTVNISYVFVAPAGICALVFIFGIFGALSNASTVASYKSGVNGEDNTAKVLSSLPNSYCCFQNIFINHDGKASEIDMVVVGPTGIFIVETKNLNSHIEGNFADREWTQHKVGRGGTAYSKDFYSPVKQVGTHVYRLAHYLRDNGIRYNINPIVYFANFETTVSLRGEATVPVFCASQQGENALINYILTCPQAIDDKNCQKIEQILLRTKK